jgi:glycine/serine hydroxymethyltransferase
MMLDVKTIEETIGLDTQDLAKRLETQDIIVDAMCRLGTNEMTRRGMVEGDMERVAELVIRAANGEDVKAEVNNLVKDLGLTFTLEDG